MSCNCRFRNELRRANIGYVPKQAVYLDYNATTPPDPAVLGAFDRACRKGWGNPSSLHVCGLDAWEIVEDTREKLSSYFGCGRDGFLFCSSGSEGLFAGMTGFLGRDTSRVPVTTVTEHAAVRHAMRICGLAGNKTETLGVDSSGKLDLPGLRRAVEGNEKTLLIFSPVNHETGAVQPVKKIASAVKNQDCLVLLDGVQAAARLSPEKWVPFCDAFVASGHKLYAPKGCACLWSSRKVRLRPHRFGGSQEGGLFPGTENVPGIASFGAAVGILEERFTGERKHTATLTAEGWKILSGRRFPVLKESPDDAVPGVLCVSLPWAKNMENLMHMLNRELICVSRFSACTSSVTGPSRILLEMGVPKERAAASLRISLGRWSTRQDFFRLAEALESVYKSER